MNTMSDITQKVLSKMIYELALDLTSTIRFTPSDKKK